MVDCVIIGRKEIFDSFKKFLDVHAISTHNSMLFFSNSFVKQSLQKKQSFPLRIS